MNYIKDRTFKISKGRHAAKYFDLVNFYCCNLNKASKQYLNNKKIDIIDNQKSNTNLPDWGNNLENIINYCIKESKLIKALGDYLVENIKNGEIQVSKFLGKKKILAPPLTTSYSLVGTAFDYLLRFYLKYLNPKAITSSWVAESSLKYLELRLEKIIERKSSEDIIIMPLIKNWYKEGKKIISKAKNNYTLFLKSGQITDSLIKSTLLLSKLDFIFRAGFTS